MNSHAVNARAFFQLFLTEMENARQLAHTHHHASLEFRIYYLLRELAPQNIPGELDEICAEWARVMPDT
jgi:hypothetical protein